MAYKTRAKAVRRSPARRSSGNRARATRSARGNSSRARTVSRAPQRVVIEVRQAPAAPTEMAPSLDLMNLVATKTAQAPKKSQF